MKKKYRLLKKQDFQQVLKNNKKIITECIVCFYKEDKKLKNIKIGIIVPKKKCKSSVDRHYLKRIVWFFNQNPSISQLPKFKCILFFTQYFFENYDVDDLPLKTLEQGIKKIHTSLINLSKNV